MTRLNKCTSTPTSKTFCNCRHFRLSFDNGRHFRLSLDIFRLSCNMVASPFLLVKVLHHHVKNHSLAIDPEVLKNIKGNLMVTDSKKEAMMWY